MTDAAKNLEIWKRFEDIDPAFTKKITGKDYGGTSPSPQYVIMCLTELFGPVGQGFGWRVLQEAFQAFGEEVVHWCRIEFWHTDRTNTFEAYGQTKAAYRTDKGKGYLKVDEDAPKKSLTDAITKAASQLGIAANIFLGRWDDSKYVDEVNREYREAESPPFNPRAAADRILGLIAKQKTVEGMTTLWTDEGVVMAEIKAAAEPVFLEIKAAFETAGKALKGKS